MKRGNPWHRRIHVSSGDSTQTPSFLDQLGPDFMSTYRKAPSRSNAFPPAIPESERNPSAVADAEANARSFGPNSAFEVDVKRWKEWRFPPGSLARRQFEYLCSLGCDPRALLSFLTVVVETSREQKSIYDKHEVSKSALKKLPERLEKISRELEAVNRLLRPFVLSFAENPKLPDQLRSLWSQTATVYQNTPGLLRWLSKDLRAEKSMIREVAGPKRYNLFRQMVLMLLDYVDTRTKSPHYEAVADLLSHLSSADQETQRVAERPPKPTRAGARKKNGAPKLLTSPDALKALYLRSAKYGFNKARRSKSKRPPSA
ncbi:MAG: hypothetical protein ABR988_14020 [Terriglobales bacterium]|jgi:hypothetical protein